MAGNNLNDVSSLAIAKSEWQHTLKENIFDGNWF